MREEGYYWVKYQGHWIVANFTFARYWCIAGDESQFYDSDFESIDEKRLMKLISDKR